MNSELDKILRESNSKKEKYNKKLKMFSWAFFSLFFLIFLALFKIFSTTFFVICYTIIFIIILFIIIKLSSKLQSLRLDVSERIAISLIKLSKTLKEYCKSANSKELTLANKRLNSIISLIKSTIFSQRQNDYSFDKSNLIFLSKLREYLNSDVKESLSIDADEDIQENIINDLEYLGKIVYSKQFNLAEKYLDKHTTLIQSKNICFEKINDFLCNSERLSSVFSFILIAFLIIFSIIKYSLLNNSNGLGVLITLLEFIIGCGIYSWLKKVIKLFLDFIFNLGSKYEEDKIKKK